MVKMTHHIAPFAGVSMCSTKHKVNLLHKVDSGVTWHVQSEKMKRLQNQNNIIKTNPLLKTMENEFRNKNDMNTTLKSIKAPEISIVPVRISNEENDANLLPSKIQDKKSEIVLFPIQKKQCGHYEPCENIICEVMVQQYVENDEASPMLAVSIEEDEINAPVTKHCENKYCDALSIDHNRCRQVLIKLYRCDKSYKCDICEIVLKNWKSRLRHKDCTRQDEYIHNNVNRRDLLRERMRERELQILEIVKMKRNDYSDPAKAIETLQKNDELIVIPKTAPSQQPIITITSIPGLQSTNLSKIQPIKINSLKNDITNLFRNVSFTVTSQNTTNCGTSQPVESKMQSLQISQINLSNLQRNTFVTSTPAATPGPVVIPTPTVISIPTTSSTSAIPTSSIPVHATIPVSIPVVSQQNKYVRLATPAQGNTTGQPLTGWIVSPTQTPTNVLSTTPIQLKPVLAPIRVMPITKLITAPSLLHRTQGIPKFCIMAIQNPTTVQQPSAVTVNTTSQEKTDKKNETSKVQLHFNSFPKINSNVSLFQKKEKRTFSCSYCGKSFTTDWYYKMHVARHEGEDNLNCKKCGKCFSTLEYKEKHLFKFHCSRCDYIYKSHADRIDHHKNVHYKTCVSKSVKSIKRKLQAKDVNPTINNIPEKIIKKSRNSPKKNKEVSVNGKTTEDNDESLKSTGIEKCDNKELTIKKDDNTNMNGHSFGSVEENIDSENFEQEIVVSC
ncbi:uncharacterized protein [Linepithema humile]|uniref:uncharacterized protein n=1 Tax=Linepithema humile TaxID=83485 RepID=UPI00062320D8|nr:PREDICTED: PR domain zinc finger protein 1-like [Linepithema humile]